MPPTLLISTRKGLFVAARGPRGWSIDAQHFLGDNCTLTLADPRDGAWYAALNLGHFGVKLHRSDDRGKSWTEVAAPSYPDRPADRPVNPQENFGKPVPWTLKLVWALEPGGVDQPGTLWCGTLPGGLFRSDDRGGSWKLVESLWLDPRREGWFGGGADWPGIHSIVVDERNSNRVFLGISCGGVWLTEDGGVTWNLRAKGMRAAYMPPEQAHDENIQDPHRLVQCRGNPDRMWVQHHNGIFRSDDEARSWTEITEAGPSTFGFGVAVHPSDPDTGWFVPALNDERRLPVGGRVVVTRTRDGGKSFDTLTRGLPQEHAYDIVFRHALDIDAGPEASADVAKARLAFGSTTGGVWTTENGGDSWDALPARLPPVYAVQFAA